MPGTNKTATHIFLTGERNVGKTTLIKRFVADAGFFHMGFRNPGGNRADAGLCVAGFSTVAYDVTEDKNADRIYIVPYGESPSISQHPAAIRNHGRTSYTAYPEVFDARGTEILTASAAADLIIMDELGFMEADAHAFQQAVLSCLDENIPVLGVIKPKQTPFLDAVRAHKDIRVLTLTPDTRMQVIEQIKIIFGEYFEKIFP